MNIVVWAVQGLLAVAFLASGAMKLFAYERARSQGLQHVSRPLVTLIGVAEILGAIGLVLPMAINVLPELTQCAGIGLAVIMALAVGYHLRHREAPTGPAVIFVLLAFVTVSRHYHLGS